MKRFEHIDVWLFDLDNTLYSHTSGFMDIFVEQLRRVAANHLGVSIEEMQQVRETLISRYGVPFKGYRKDYNMDMDKYIEEAFDLDLSLLKPCPKTRKIIQKIPGKKVIFSNSPALHVHRVLKHLGLDDLFEEVFDVTQVDFEVKPGQVFYDYVLDKLQVPAEKCAMVEDSAKNLEPARAMGMTTILVNHTEEKQQPHVQYQYDTLLDWLTDLSLKK